MEVKQWVYKYQPRNLDQYIGNTEFKSMLKHHIDDKSVPSILLHGVPGTGKSSVMRMLRNVFDDICQTYFLNGSQVTTKEAVNGALLPIINSAIPMGKTYKLILIDEFDRISAQAQDSLKVTIENAMASNIRFILASNNFDRIDSALKSRFSRNTYNITPPSKSQVFTHLFRIMCSERIIFDVNVFTNEMLMDVVHYVASKGISLDSIKSAFIDLYATNEDFKRELVEHGIDKTLFGLNKLFTEVMTIVDHKYPDIRSCINVTDASCTTGKFRLQTSLLDNSIYLDVIIKSHLNSLKSDNINEIRSIITNANSDTDTAYDFLYSHLNKITPNNVGDAIIVLAEYQHKNKGLFSNTQKIINLHAAIIQLIKIRLNS